MNKIRMTGSIKLRTVYIRIFISVLISFFVLATVNCAKADTFPLFSRTVTREAVGVTNYTMLTPASGSPIVVLNIHMSQSGVASDTVLYCGSVALAKNYAKETADIYMSYVCENSLIIKKTGAQDSSFIQLTYRPYYTSEPTQPVVVVSGDISVPNFDLWLGFAAFFAVFFAVVYYFRRNIITL